MLVPVTHVQVLSCVDCAWFRLPVIFCPRRITHRNSRKIILSWRYPVEFTPASAMCSAPSACCIFELRHRSRLDPSDLKFRVCHNRLRAVSVYLSCRGLCWRFGMPNGAPKMTRNGPTCTTIQVFSSSPVSIEIRAMAKAAMNTFEITSRHDVSQACFGSSVIRTSQTLSENWLRALTNKSNSNWHHRCLVSCASSESMACSKDVKRNTRGDSLRAHRTWATRSMSMRLKRCRVQYYKTASKQMLAVSTRFHKYNVKHNDCILDPARKLRKARLRRDFMTILRRPTLDNPLTVRPGLN